MRMDDNAYAELLELMTPRIPRQATVMQKVISPHERFSCILRWLATGRSYRDLSYSAAISEQEFSQRIPETCEAIYAALKEQCLKVSQNATNITKKLFQ